MFHLYEIEMKLKILIKVFLFVASISRKLISTWSRNILNLYYIKENMYTFYKLVYKINFIFHNKNNSRAISFSEIRKIIKEIIKINC